MEYRTFIVKQYKIAILRTFICCYFFYVKNSS